MTNTGTGDGSCAFTKAAMSLITVLVGPVRPLSADRCTLRPHPRWSKPYMAIPRSASPGKSP